MALSTTKSLRRRWPSPTREDIDRAILVSEMITFLFILVLLGLLFGGFFLTKVLFWVLIVLVIVGILQLVDRR